MLSRRSANQQKAKSRTEQQHPHINVQHAEQRHQHHQKQIVATEFQYKHTNVNGDRAAERPRNAQLSDEFLRRGGIGVGRGKRLGLLVGFRVPFLVAQGFHKQESVKING